MRFLPASLDALLVELDDLDDEVAGCRHPRHLAHPVALPARGEHIRAEFSGSVEEIPELDRTIALDARDRRFAGEICLVDVRRAHLVLDTVDGCVAFLLSYLVYGRYLRGRKVLVRQHQSLAGVTVDRADGELVIAGACVDGRRAGRAHPDAARPLPELGGETREPASAAPAARDRPARDAQAGAAWAWAEAMKNMRPAQMHCTVRITDVSSGALALPSGFRVPAARAPE